MNELSAHFHYRFYGCESIDFFVTHVDTSDDEDERNDAIHDKGE